MSCFYTVEQISAGLVPAVDDFDIARELVTRALEAEPAILGAIFCGSALGKPTRSSDMDVVVLYDAAQVERAYRTLRYCVMISSSQHVPLELICLDDQIARLGVHGINGSFAIHLAGCVDRGGLVKANPLEIIQPQVGDLMSQLRVYVTGKLHKLQKLMARVNYSQQQEFLLCREILDTPVHVARKYLRATNQVLETDSSGEVCRVFGQVSSGETAQLLGTLHGARLEYDRRLDLMCQMAGSSYGERLVAEHAYLMRDLKRLSFDALRFVRTIALAVGPGTVT